MMFCWWIPWLFHILEVQTAYQNGNSIVYGKYLEFSEATFPTAGFNPIKHKRSLNKQSKIWSKNSRPGKRGMFVSIPPLRSHDGAFEKEEVLEGMGGSPLHKLVDNNYQRFVAEPTPQMAVIGSTAVLPCRVMGKVGHLQWTKDGFGLGTDRNLFGYDRYSMIGSDDEGDFSLRIHPILLDDDALFQCQVSAGDQNPAIQSRAVRLTVYVPPDPPTLHPNIVRATSGDSVDIECVSEGGRPPPEVQWIDDSTREPIHLQITESKEKMSDHKRFTVKSKLSFIPQRRHDNQSITCSISHQALSSSLVASVPLHINFPPEVSLKVHPEPITEGDNLTFTCDAVANPSRISYRWFRHDLEILNETSRILKIQNVRRDFHQGTISCEVINKVGSSRKTHTTLIRYGPSFRKSPRNIMTEIGSEIDLICDVDSNPPANIVWLRRHSHEILGHGSTLRLNVDSTTAGVYQCIASVRGRDFEFSDLKGAIQVLIKGPPRILSDSEQLGRRGDTVSLECKALSIPKPIRVTWSYKGRDIDQSNSRYKIISDELNEGLSNILMIKGTTSSDFGEYNCSVVNEYGVVRKLIHLKEEKRVPVLLLVVSVTIALLVICVVFSLVICNKRRSSKNEKVSDTKSGSESNKDVPLSNLYSTENKETPVQNTESIAKLDFGRSSPAHPNIDLIAGTGRARIEQYGNGIRDTNVPTNGSQIQPDVSSYVNTFIGNHRLDTRRSSMTDVNMYSETRQNISNPPEFCTLRRTSKVYEPRLLSSPVKSAFPNGNVGLRNESDKCRSINGTLEQGQSMGYNHLPSTKSPYAYVSPSAQSPPPPPPYQKNTTRIPQNTMGSPPSLTRPVYDESSRLSTENNYIFSPEAILKPGTLV